MIAVSKLRFINQRLFGYGGNIDHLGWTKTEGLNLAFYILVVISNLEQFNQHKLYLWGTDLQLLFINEY